MSNTEKEVPRQGGTANKSHLTPGPVPGPAPGQSNEDAGEKAGKFDQPEERHGDDSGGAKKVGPDGQRKIQQND